MALGSSQYLAMLADWYGLECIRIAITMKDYEAGGCVVLVQRADNPNPNHWRVWHTPITDKWKVFQTAPNDWTDRGWYDHVTSAPVPRAPVPRAKAKAKGKVKAKAKAKAKLSCHP